MAWAIILGAFAAAVLVAWRIDANPGRIGCLLPVAVMALTLGAVVALRITGSHVNAAAPIGIFVNGLLAACGSIPGALLGTALRRPR